MSLVFATLALALDLTVLIALMPPAAAVPAASLALPLLALFGHAQPRRGRAPSTIACAAAFASAFLWLGLAIWLGRDAASWTTIGGILVVPWPGHALALLPRAPTISPGPQLVHDRMARIVKRASDLVLALPFGLLAIPVVTCGAILVRATTPGPAFYSQTRVTRDGRLFRIWKLRTMERNAEAGTPVWPEDNDPRITRVGRILRMVWIDELPQMWNVVCGDMSLVGPRPERPEFVEAFAAELPKYQRRHAVAAGITGLAQVTGLIGDTSIRRRLALDLHYIRIWTPGLDGWILASTAILALRRAIGRPPSNRRSRRTARGMGGSILELRGVARHLPERDQRN